MLSSELRERALLWERDSLASPCYKASHMSEPPSNKKKIKLYSRKHYYLDIPADPALPIVQRTTPEPERFMLGTEFTRHVDGREVTMVSLQDGTVAPLSDLMIAITDLRENELGRMYRKVPPPTE